MDETHTSVILRCPDALYLWFEDELAPGCTVNHAMLAVLNDWWKTMNTPEGVTEARCRAWLALRLVEAAPPLELPPPVPTRALPAVPKVAGTKYRKKNQRRRVRR